MYLRAVALLLLPISLLASCAMPLSSRGKEHKQAITHIVEVAKNFDLGSGDIENLVRFRLIVQLMTIFNTSLRLPTSH